jgi:GAF domain-containing protein
MARDERLMDTFVVLADTLVANYDIIDFLQLLAERSVELLDTSAAGIMLADADGQLRHAACSSEQMRLVELFELQIEQGPCFDAYNQRAPVRCDRPEDAEARWPGFAARAVDAGFLAMSAVPLRLRDDVVGALNMFSATPHALSDEDLRVAQAMADVATVGILQERAIRDSRAFSTQLEVALHSRIVIEQSKGILAEHHNTNVDEAFDRLRAYARNNNKLLSDTARQVVDGSLAPEAIGRSAASSGPYADQA